ncbi:MAG: YrbL family protein [Planctomycetota bacterium]
MLTFTESDLINRGANRACYQHPEDARRCIKVDLPEGQGTRRGLNQIEFEHYGKLADRLGERLYRHAPRCHGFVETSLGPGLCFDRVLNADGSPSVRINFFIKHHSRDLEQVVQLVDRLHGFVRDAGVLLFDVNRHNLLVRVDAAGEPELIVIDWKGAQALREWLPVSSLLPYFGRRKVARRFARLREQSVAKFERTHGISRRRP